MRCLLAIALVASSTAFAKDKPTITYKAPTAEDERPLATEILVGPQGSDFAFRVDFDKVPWGDSCKNRCANATLFLDTDNSTATGLQLPDKKAPENGADMSVTIQGAREYKESSADVLLRVKVRQFSDTAKSIEDGETLAELDHRRDPERVQVDDKTVYVLVDATNGTLPSGSKIRVIYHPPDAKPLVGYAHGLTASGAGKVEIFKAGRHK